MSTTGKWDPMRNGHKRSDLISKHADEISIGIVGLGLMGMSITACLLAAGHPVVAVTRDVSDSRNQEQKIRSLLKQMVREGLLRLDPTLLLGNLIITQDYAALSLCKVVIESIVESVEEKQSVIDSIEAHVPADTVIGSNTSAIPVTLLQSKARHPERVLGIHWAEPAHITRFMEVICGDRTNLSHAHQIVALAEAWGKEPSLLLKDIRGFITNRLMYALLREAFHLIENGYATYEDIDRSLRNDLGYWMTFAGPFRFMDLTGIPAYAAVMKDLWPELSCSTEVPPLMEKLVQSGALGVANARGFYSYTPEEARHWEEQFLKFTYDIRTLALKYNFDRKNSTEEPPAPAKKTKARKLVGATTKTRKSK